MRTLKTIGIVGGAIALLLSASVAFAQDQSTSTTSNHRPEKERPMLISSSTPIRGATQNAQEKLQNIKERLQSVRDEVQTKLKEQRDKITTRLENIKDKMKQEKAAKLSEQFDNLNKIWTDKFAKQLDSYDAILQKVQDRANTAAGKGKDVTSTTAAITSAKAAIATARTAVIAQAAKTYDVDPATIPTTATSTPSGQENIMKNLQASFKNLHATLFKDLFALRDGAMKDAHKAVQAAIQTLGKINGDNATSTPSSNHQ